MFLIIQKYYSEEHWGGFCFDNIVMRWVIAVIRFLMVHEI